MKRPVQKSCRCKYGIFYHWSRKKFPTNYISANFSHRFRCRRLFGYYVAFASCAFATSDLIHWYPGTVFLCEHTCDSHIWSKIFNIFWPIFLIKTKFVKWIRTKRRTEAYISQKHNFCNFYLPTTILPDFAVKREKMFWTFNWNFMRIFRFVNLTISEKWFEKLRSHVMKCILFEWKWIVFAYIFSHIFNLYLCLYFVHLKQIRSLIVLTQNSYQYIRTTNKIPCTNTRSVLWTYRKTA